jgi:hypothetical protein
MSDHFEQVWLRGGPYGEAGRHVSIPGDGLQFVMGYVRQSDGVQEHWWKPAVPTTAEASEDSDFAALVYDYVGTERPEGT